MAEQERDDHGRFAGSGLSTWAKSKAPVAEKKYLVTDGKNVISSHDTKKDAHAAGMERRRAGLQAYAFKSSDFKKFNPGGMAK